MSGAETSRKYPGRIRTDYKLVDHLLGPNAEWMKNMSIVSGVHNKKKALKPKMYAGTATSIIKKMRSTLKV